LPQVDLIIADLRLADGASGVDAVASLRALLRADIPAMVVSGDVTESARAEARASRMSLLSKPVVAPALFAAARAAMELRFPDAPERSPVNAGRHGEAAAARNPAVIP